MDSSVAPTDPSSYRWDVFLSFRGEDTRLKFISHLESALRLRGVNVFIDYKLPRGENISTFLLETIEESKISIVVISEDYASSSWCLDELVKIIECKKYKRQVVLPIFYEVNPSHVRKQTGDFGKGFAKHERNRSSKIPVWREALETISNLSAWVTQNDQYVSRFLFLHQILFL